MAKKSDKKAGPAQNIAPGQEPAATPAPNTTSGDAQAGDASDQTSASPDVASGQQHNPPASSTNQPGAGSDEQPAATPATNTTAVETQAGDASDQKSASPDVASGQLHNPPASSTNQPGAGSDEQSPVPGGGKRGVDYQISVVSKPVTFRRAGKRFSRTPTVLNLGDLSDDQIQALIDEPNLTIKEVVDEKAD